MEIATGNTALDVLDVHTSPIIWLKIRMFFTPAVIQQSNLGAFCSFFRVVNTLGLSLQMMVAFVVPNNAMVCSRLQSSIVEEALIDAK